MLNLSCLVVLVVSQLFTLVTLLNYLVCSVILLVVMIHNTNVPVFQLGGMKHNYKNRGIVRP